MNKLILSILAAISLALPAKSATAYFRGKGTAITTNLSYFIPSCANGVPVFDSLVAQSDSANSIIKMWAPTNNGTEMLRTVIDLTLSGSRQQALSVSDNVGR